MLVSHRFGIVHIYASPDDQQHVRESYGTGYDRLAQIKRRCGPANLFHLNQNISPAAG